jgi:hypothetical protein
MGVPELGVDKVNETTFARGSGITEDRTVSRRSDRREIEVHDDSEYPEIND